MRNTLAVAVVAITLGLSAGPVAEAKQPSLSPEIEAVIADYRVATRKCGLLTNGPYDKQSCSEADRLMGILVRNEICARPNAESRSPADVILAPCNSTQKSTVDPRSCAPRGEIFAMVAAIRDQGYSPETALHDASQYLGKGIPDLDEHFIKLAINTVYFEPEFISAGGQLLAQQVRQMCLGSAKPKFKPLE